MGFFKGVLFGIAAYAVVQHITKKDILTGRSIVDDLIDKTPEYIHNVKEYVGQVKEELRDPYPTA